MNKRLLCFSITLLFAALFLAGPVLAQPSDIGGHWAEKQISEWADKGLAKGYPDGSFMPDSTITRAEFITLVNNSFGLRQRAEASFSDVGATDWFTEEIAKARAAGYIAGYEDGTVKPDNPISRQEAAAILAKISKLDISGSPAAVNKFKDSASISRWSSGAVSAVVTRGYMSGYPDKTFRPETFITRAEAISTLDRTVKGVAAHDVVYDKAGTYGPAAGTEIIEGNITVSVRDVKLQNMVIKGDILLAEGIGDGDVTLKNVAVGGNTTIKGGGSHSVVLEDCSLPSITIGREGVRVVSSGSTSVSVVTLESGATLVLANISGPAFKNVTVSQKVPANSVISLTGNFQAVNVEAANVIIGVKEGTVDSLNVFEQARGSVIEVAGGASIHTLTLNAAVSAKGKGKIEKANVNVSGSKFEEAPNSLVKAREVEVSITTASGNAGGGGGGGGGGSASDNIQTFSQAGVFGPATGTETYNKNVVIAVAGVTLQNMAINGDLEIAAGVGSGEVTLKNITVSGATRVNGGGSNSVNMEDCTLPSITVNKENVRIVARGSTRVNVVTLQSGATLVEVSVSGQGFETVTVSQVIPVGAAIELDGDFQSVNVQASSVNVAVVGGTVASFTVDQNSQGSVVNVSSQAQVTTLTLHSAATVSGTGTVQTANVNASGSTIQQTPATVNKKPGVTVAIGIISSIAATKDEVTVTFSQNILTVNGDNTITLASGTYNFDIFTGGTRLGHYGLIEQTANSMKLAILWDFDNTQTYVFKLYTGDFLDNPDIIAQSSEFTFQSWGSDVTVQVSPFNTEPDSIWVTVQDTGSSELITGLAAEDFTLFGSDGNKVATTFTAGNIVDELIPGHEYRLTPLSGLFEGVYRIKFAKSGYKSNTQMFTVDPASAAKDITAFSLAEQTGPATIGDGTIAVEVTNGTALTGLVATFSLSAGAQGAAVGVTPQVSGVTANDFSAPVTYVITAEDGTTKNWVVTVTEAAAPLSNQAIITAFSLAEQTGPATIGDGTIAVEVANGTALTGLVATFSLSAGAQGAAVGVTPQVSGVTANDFSAPVTYVITAEDGTTKNWVVTVTEAAAPVSPPVGDLLDAEAGANFIGAVYTRDGKIYYNKNENNTWGEEKEIGIGTEGKIAIDKNGNTHIAYTTDGKIGYRSYNGSAWSSEQTIISNNSGTCSKPDIAVGASVYAHITYTDTMGNTNWYQNKPDIMYATNASGSFAKTLIYDGYYENLGGADYIGDYFNKGSYIAVDSSGNYFIAAHKYAYNKNMSFIDKTYSIAVKSNLGTGGTTGASSDTFDIYDLEADGDNIYILYKQSDFKESELLVGGTTISFANTSTIAASSVSSVSPSPAAVVIGGKNAGNLQICYNTESQVYNDIAVKGSIVSVVNFDGTFYAVFTDNSDNLIKIKEIVL